MENFGFTPSANGSPTMSSAPVSQPGEFGFVPAGGKVNGASAPAPAATGGGLGQFALSVGKGALDFANNNSISSGIRSIAALPFQGLAKALGQPDPFARGIGTTAPPASKVTSSDQPFGKFAEEELGNAATVGSMFVPAGRAAEAAVPLLSPILGRFAPAAARIGTQTALGAFQGLAGGMQDGQTGAELKSSAKTGAFIGGGLAAAGEFGSALLHNFSSNTPETRLGEQTNRLKTLQNSFDDNSTFKKDATTGKMISTSDPIKTLSDTGLIKGLKVVDGRVNTEAVESGMQDMLASQDKQASVLVKNMPGTVPLDLFKAAVEDSIKKNPQIRDAGKVAPALAEIERRFSDYTTSFGNGVTYPQIDDIRVAMNKEFNPELRDVARTIGDTARGVLYDSETGSPELKQLMGAQGRLLKAQNFVDRLRGTVVRGGRLGKYLADMVGSGVGSAMGSTMGPFGIGAGAMLGGMAADKAMGMYQNNFFDPLLAGPASALSRFAATPAADAVTRLGKATLIPSAVKQ